MARLLGRHESRDPGNRGGVMEWIKRLWRRARLLARGSAAERAMRLELDHHIACEIADRIKGGMTPAEARRTALRDFGGVEAIKEQARDARGGRALEDLTLDVRYAARLLRRNPGYSLAGVLTFALGVGAVTAIFSLVYGILLRPLPYRSPDRLVAVWERNVPKNRDRNVVSLDNYEAWRDRAHSFGSIAAVVPATITLPGDPAPERLAGADVTTGYFSTLGISPALGRDFSPDDARDGRVVILSDGLWKRRFNGDPSLVGRAITMSGKAYTVVGIMPPGFDPPRLGWLGSQDLWFPFVATAQTRGYGRFLIVLARLAPGASIEQSRAEMTAITAQRAAESPVNAAWSASVVPLAEQMTGDVRTSLLVLLAAVALLLLMAIANVATLTLSLLGRRAQELAVRRAIGATDRRLFRQLFTQSALVGLMGAAVGALVAVPGVRVLVALLPPDIPRPGSVDVDAPVLLVIAAIALAATLAFGSIAAFRGRRSDGMSVMTRAAGDGRASARANSGALVAIEIALAVVLGVMAVLMTRSFAELRRVDLGFAPAGVVVARVALPGSYATPQSQRDFFEQLAGAARRLPGVTAAGIISARPFNGIGPATTVHDARRPADSDQQDPVADVRYADAQALPALGIRLVGGAWFDARDVDGPPRVIISETLARTVWPDSDPVGQHLAMELFGGIRPTVAGVVRDVHLMDARTPPRPAAYLSVSHFTDGVRDLVVRVDGDPAGVVPSLRATVAALDSSLPLYNVATLPAMVEASLAEDRLTMFLLVGFASIALLLAAVGVFGVFAGDVTRRRKEIGIRLALGARESSIVWMLLRQAFIRAALGVAAGAVLAAVLGRAMESLLFGVGAADPATFAIVVALVLALALAATLGPAVQALRRSPLATLREG